MLWQWLLERRLKRFPLPRARFLVRDGIECVESRQPILRSRYFLRKNIGNACQWAFVFSGVVGVFCWWLFPDATIFLQAFIFAVAFLNGIVYVYLGFWNRKILYSLTLLPEGLQYLRTLPKEKTVLPYEEIRIRPIHGKNRGELGYLEYCLEIAHADQIRLFPCADARECQEILTCLENHGLIGIEAFAEEETPTRKTL